MQLGGVEVDAVPGLKDGFLLLVANGDGCAEDERETPEMAREIRRIPPPLRNALVLRELHELPMPEVTARLGISVAAVKSRLLRARAGLRERKHAGRLGAATLTLTA